MKFKNDEKLTVATNEVGKTVTLQGHTFMDYFFISKNEGRRDGYRVTHKMSGLYIVNYIPTLRQACELCQIISPIIDWQFSSPRQVWEEEPERWKMLMSHVLDFMDHMHKPR